LGLGFPTIIKQTRALAKMNMAGALVFCDLIQLKWQIVA
jgi:hypothetical protein